MAPAEHEQAAPEDHGAEARGWAAGHSQSGPPSSYVPTVRFVLPVEGSPERWLLIQHDEQMSDEKEQASIAEESERLIKERGTGEGESSADVHGIPHSPVRALDHEPARRVKRRRRPSADQGEREDAP